MSQRILLPVVLAALLLTAYGGAGNAITFTLQPRHGSHLLGAATLSPRAHGSRLTIDLHRAYGPPRGATVALYDGSCSTVLARRETRRLPLPRLQLSASLSAPPATYIRSDYALAVRRGGVVVACGDVAG